MVTHTTIDSLRHIAQFLVIIPLQITGAMPLNCFAMITQIVAPTINRAGFEIWLSAIFRWANDKFLWVFSRFCIVQMADDILAVVTDARIRIEPHVARAKGFK